MVRGNAKAVLQQEYRILPGKRGKLEKAESKKGKGLLDVWTSDNGAEYLK
jgi:hypothetical protein